MCLLGQERDRNTTPMCGERVLHTAESVGEDCEKYQLFGINLRLVIVVNYQEGTDSLCLWIKP